MDGPYHLYEAFIRANLPLASAPLVPEIRLHKAGPASGLRRLADTPYWAYTWGGGLALARYILDHPETVAGRHVVDIGTGSGLVAIAAAKAGAERIAAVDLDPYAVAATALNAEANAVAVTASLEDPLEGPVPEADVILVGDLFYEPRLAGRTTEFLTRCRAAGRSVLIGDPWRTHLPRARLRLLAEYRLADFGDVPGTTATASAVFDFA